MELNASCFAAVTIWEKKWRTACYFSPLCGTAAKCQFCLNGDYCSRLSSYQFCSKYQCNKCAKYNF